MARVAFLGLGIMGYPMAGHLKNKGGHEVTVYNRTAAKAAKWIDQYGGRSASTPKAAAEGQDFIMCCVGNDSDLREVTLVRLTPVSEQMVLSFIAEKVLGLPKSY